jgi:hypothetical protein
MMEQNLQKCHLSSFALNPKLCDEYPVNENLIAFLFLFSLFSLTLFYVFIVDVEVYFAPDHSKCQTHTHIYKHTLGRISLDEGSARPKDLYMTTRNTHKRQTSIAPGGS